MLGPRPPLPAPATATPRASASIIAPRRTSARRPAATAVLPALLLALAPGAFAHGYLRLPRSRNHVASWGQDGAPNRDCSKEDCSKIPRYEYSQGQLNRYRSANIQSGFCGVTGDADKRRGIERGYTEVIAHDGSVIEHPKPEAWWTEGEEVTLKWHIEAHHAGHVEVGVCCEDPRTTEEADMVRCFNEHKMEFVEDVLYGAPKDPLRPERAMLAPERYMKKPSTQGLSYRFPMPYEVRMRVPEGQSGERCLLRWVYYTAHVCEMPGYDDYPYPENGWRFTWRRGGHQGRVTPCDLENVTMVDGEIFSNVDFNDDLLGNAKWPERFWNCADVQIRGPDGGEEEEGPQEPPESREPAAAPSSPGAYDWAAKGEQLAELDVKFHGCVESTSALRVFGLTMPMSPKGFSVKACKEKCRGFKFFALQDGTTGGTCACSPTPPAAGPLLGAADRSVCGGPKGTETHAAVFKVTDAAWGKKPAKAGTLAKTPTVGKPAGAKYLGCYADGLDARRSAGSFEASRRKPIGPAACMQKCTSRAPGATHFALTYAADSTSGYPTCRCYRGKAGPKVGARREAGECRRPCRGSQYFRDRPWLDTACGDVGTEAVYALRPAKDRKKDKEEKASRGGTAPAPPGGR